MTKKPYVFVLMPFAEKWKEFYEKGIKGTCEKAGCRCERVDEQSFSQPILEHIYKQIRKADVIVAELSENNTNVFYEVGYAHANHKTVILLAQEKKQIPFDLQFYQFVIYNSDLDNLQQQLTKKLAWAIKESQKPSRQIPPAPPIPLAKTGVSGPVTSPTSYSSIREVKKRDTQSTSQYGAVLKNRLEVLENITNNTTNNKISNKEDEIQKLLLKLDEIRFESNDQDIEQRVEIINRLLKLGEKELPLYKFDLSGASLENIDLSGADLRDVNFGSAKLQGANFSLADLRGAYFFKSDLKCADFQEADLQEAQFVGAELYSSSFHKADLQKAIFKDVQLKDVDLLEAILKNVDFSGLRLPMYNFSKKNLDGTNFEGCYLRNANFANAVLKKTNFQGAYLYGADFKDADLVEVNFKEADLRKADLTGADLSDSNLSSTKGLTFEMLIQTKSLYGVIGLEASLSERLKQKKQELFLVPIWNLVID